MPETNGRPVGLWAVVTAREVVLAASCLLPALIGYIKLQGDVNAIKDTFVSHDQMQVELQKEIGAQAVQNERLSELTQQMKDNNENMQQLTLELKAMRLEWSNYRSHR